jgi:hypothetical protein
MERLRNDTTSFPVRLGLPQKQPQVINPVPGTAHFEDTDVRSMRW